MKEKARACLRKHVQGVIETCIPNYICYHGTIVNAKQNDRFKTVSC